MLYLSVLYKLFGTNPLGYHLFNNAVLTTGIILFYLCIRELDQDRAIALSITLIYALSPDYSTDRFWYIAAPIVLSMTLYFLSLYSDLKAIKSNLGRLLSWKSISIISIIGSTLSYEVALPLFFLNPILVWLSRKEIFARNQNKTTARIKLAFILGVNLFVLILIIIYKATTTVRTEFIGIYEQLHWFTSLMMDSVRVNYILYGIQLPLVVSKIVRNYFDLTIFFITIFIALLIFCYIFSASKTFTAEPPKKNYFLRLTFLGILIFLFGYAIFLTNQNAAIASTGINNRIAIAGAAGVAISFVGIIGLVGTFFRSEHGLRVILSLLVAFICASGFLTNNTIASFWSIAYKKEKEILANIRETFPTLPKGSIFFLDGVCPYAGPAIVFESHFDLAGALSMIYKDYSLRADVVKPNLKITDGGLITSMYGFNFKYPYEKMLIFNYESKNIHKLNNVEDAMSYFQNAVPSNRNSCPLGYEGHGVKIF
jgi:hypothetical protein